MIPNIVAISMVLLSPRSIIINITLESLIHRMEPGLNHYDTRSSIMPSFFFSFPSPFTTSNTSSNVFPVSLFIQKDGFHEDDLKSGQLLISSFTYSWGWWWFHYPGRRTDSQSLFSCSICYATGHSPQTANKKT